MHGIKGLWRLLQIMLVITVMTACSSGLENMPSKSGISEEDEEILDQRTGKNAEVATVNDQTFLYKDLEFYMLMNKVLIELEQAEDLKGLEGEEAVERTEYWNEQREYYDNINVSLEKLIEINGLLYVANEKEYTITKEDLKREIKAFKRNANNNKKALALIKEYGEAKYNDQINEYIHHAMLHHKVEKEIGNQIAKENPNISEEVISDLMDDRIEELSVMDVVK